MKNIKKVELFLHLMAKKNGVRMIKLMFVKMRFIVIVNVSY